MVQAEHSEGRPLRKVHPGFVPGIAGTAPERRYLDRPKKVNRKDIKSGQYFEEIDRWDEEGPNQSAERWSGTTMFEYAFPSITFEPLEGGGVTDSASRKELKRVTFEPLDGGGVLYSASGEEPKPQKDMKRCLYSPFLARRIFEPLSKWKWGRGGSERYRFDIHSKPTKREENLVRIVNDTFGREKIGVNGGSGPRWK